MSDIVISYARSTAAQAQAAAEALRALGYEVWLDDELPAHRAYGDVIDEHLSAAKAVLVIWSDEAVKSDWVRSEANRAREARKLVQLTIDNTPLPMPFDQIHCVDMHGWKGDTNAGGWAKIVRSIAELLGKPATESPVTTAAPAAPIPNTLAIAVIPFSNLSRDSNLEHLAQGITADLIVSLRSRSGFWRVVGGHHSDVSRPPQEVGRGRGVQYVLSGTVQGGTDVVRANVRLTEVSHGHEMWTERYDHPSDDLLGAQDKVVTATAFDLLNAILLSERTRVHSRPVEELDAFGLCARADAIELVDRASRDEALTLLRRAVEIDPNLAFAHALLGVVLTDSVAAQISANPDSDATEALACAARASNVDPNDVSVMNYCAHIYCVVGDDALALQLAQRATAKLGRDTTYLYHALIQSGRSAEVMARATAPTGRQMFWVAFACTLEGRYEDALHWLEKSAASFPNNFSIWTAKANVLALLNRIEKARDAWQQAKRFAPNISAARYERGQRAFWRNRTEIVEPLVAGVRKLDID